MTLYRFELRRDTAANWASVNPILAPGEPAVETDTYRVKFGDGTTEYNSLPYAGNSTADASLLSTGIIAYSRLPIGAIANTVAAGNDSRFTNSRTPTGSAGGALSGTYPNPGLAAGYGTVAPSFSAAGIIGAGALNFRWYNDIGRTLTITLVRASLGTAPTGSAAIVDVAKNGTSIFTSGNAPTIAAGAHTATSTVIATASVASGDYLTIAINQVGSTIPGADLTAGVVMS